ncbi:hypothetical protein [Treponema sp. TIM-1]
MEGPVYIAGFDYRAMRIIKEGEEKVLDRSVMAWKSRETARAVS